MIGDSLSKVTPEQALGIIEKFMDRFGMTELNLDFDCKPCGELYGCYFPRTNTLCLQLDPRDGKVPEYVVYHEMGHALERMYYRGNETFSYAQGEGFARYIESLYLTTNGKFLDFKCECGSQLIKILPDGSIECVGCGDVYYAPVYQGLMSSGGSSSGVRGCSTCSPLRGQPPVTGAQLSPVVAQIAHTAIGSLFVLVPAAAKPGDVKWQKVGLGTGAALVAVKEGVVDPALEGATLTGGAVDASFYALGALGGMLILKAAGQRTLF